MNIDAGFHCKIAKTEFGHLLIFTGISGDFQQSELRWCRGGCSAHLHLWMVRPLCDGTLIADKDLIAFDFENCFHRKNTKFKLNFAIKWHLCDQI